MVCNRRDGVTLTQAGRVEVLLLLAVTHIPGPDPKGAEVLSRPLASHDPRRSEQVWVGEIGNQRQWA